MGKASRRRTTRARSGEARRDAAPFVARPFAGLPSETEWVAMRELLPAATATVRLLDDERTATVATVLPLAWPAMHRADGELFVATQSGATSGDPSRDLAAGLLLAAAAPQSSPVSEVPLPLADSPRLQDILDVTEPFEAQVHDGFEFWVGDTELDAEGQASLRQANESVIPTERVEVEDGAAQGAQSVFWCVITQRRFVRWVLPYAEDDATDALARLLAGGRADLGDGTRLLGAFRAGGLLVPVWELSDDLRAADVAQPVAELGGRLVEALAVDGPLTAEERRARAGLVNRQVTLR